VDPSSSQRAVARVPNEKELFIGKLKGINEKKGWGIIASEAAQKVHGQSNKDIIALKNDLNSEVKAGDTISFCVAQGQRGPHAINIKPFEAPAADEVFVGSVKSFNDVKGWGFVALNDESRGWSMDVFVHKKELQGLVPKPGDTLQFTIDVGAGRLSAKGVTLVAKGKASR